MDENKPYWDKKSTDFTNNGKCSCCGSCCSSIIPVTNAEMMTMKNTADMDGFVPKIPGEKDTVYIRCPFLMDVQVPSIQRKCAVYDVRPMVCRAFDCSLSTQDGMKRYHDMIGTDAAPAARNLWEIYNKTGLRLNGKEIPFDNAPACELTVKDGTTYEIFVGRPLRFTRKDGREYPPSMVIALYRDGIQYFDGIKQEPDFVRWDEIAEIMSLPVKEEITDSKEK